MSKALQHNYVVPNKNGIITARAIQEALTALHENGEKIICVVPTKHNAHGGQVLELFITTEVGY